MLCHRYGNPAFFIDSALACGVFSKSITALFSAEDDERLWDIYLNGDMQQSFNDWKAEVMRKNKADKGMTTRELIAAENDAKNIMKGLIPK